MSHPRVIGMLLGVITLLVYSPVRHYPFVEYDDSDYVTQNQVVQAGLSRSGLEWAFTTFQASNWHPLTWLSHMLDCELFGSNAGGHHLVNVSLHCLNAVVLFVLLLRMTKALWQSALVAALFAWHPLRVESVAWVAERKDVLSAFFGLLTLTAYVRYAQRRSRVESRESSEGTTISSLDARRSTLDYCLALLFFGMGLMAKPMVVTLPFVFLLLDYWPLQRVPGFEFRVSHWSRLVLEKWPFYVLAAGSCLVTFLAQQHGASVVGLELYPGGLRLENAVVSYVRYLCKMAWPADLSVFYPPRKEIPSVQVVAATVVLVTISWLSWRARREKPYLLTGWLWFLGMLVPVIGLVQVGMQTMADRYTYLPAIGVCIGVVFGAGELAAKLQVKPTIMVSITSLILAGCVFGTVWQLRFWRDSEALFEHAVAVTRDYSLAENNLGCVLLKIGLNDEAITHFQKAIEIQPEFSVAQAGLGTALLQKGQIDEAIAHLQKALERHPNFLVAQYNLGTCFLRKGNFDEAIVHFQLVLEIQPDDAKAHYNLGRAHLQKGNVNEAIVHYQRASEIQPRNSGLLNNLAWLLATAPEPALRNGSRAVELAEQADRFSSGKDPEIIGTLAAAYAEAGRFSEAIAAGQQALRLAAFQTNAAVLVSDLQTQIVFYRAGFAFRDKSLMNRQ